MGQIKPTLLVLNRAVKDGNHSQIKKAFESLMRTLDLTRHGPLEEGIRDEETYILVRELPRALERYFMLAMDKPQKRSPKNGKGSVK